MMSVQEKIKREEDIIKIMAVFPSDRYKANPTPEQIEQLVKRAEAMGVTVEGIHNYFAFGINNFAEFDALIKELAAGWRPAGEVVEAGETAQPASVDDPLAQAEKLRCEFPPPQKYRANSATLALLSQELEKCLPEPEEPRKEPLQLHSLYGINIEIDETVPDGQIKPAYPEPSWEWLFNHRPLLMDDETVRRLGGIIPEEDE
jgi:hypothetical protein